LTVHLNRGLALLALLTLLDCAGCGGSSGGGTDAPSTATPATVDAPAAPDLRFGVQTHFAQGWPLSWVPAASALGIPTIRDELYWNVVETSAGVYTFPAAYDAYMAALKQANLAPLIELDFANPNYDGGETPYTASGIAAYANYAVAVLGHYGSQIGAVEIWNEYNGTFASGPATEDEPGTYTRMLKQAYAQIKGQRPDVTVLGGATAGVPLPYWQQLFQDGALSSMDALSIHPYRYNQPPEGIETAVTALQNLTEQYDDGKAKPIWVTEIGWPIQGAGDGQLAIDETTQAKFLVRAYALLLAAGVQRIYWYDLVDDPNSPMGLYRPDGTARPSATALKVMIQQLSGAAFQEEEPSADGVYSIFFTRPDGTQIRVMWSLQPTQFAVAGVTSVTDLLGNSVPVGGQLSLSDSPVYVAGTLTGLPAAPSQTLETDSTLDFSGTQGQKGWWYGYSVAGGPFLPLTDYTVSSWTPEWTDAAPYLDLTPGDQHPSVEAVLPVAAVRRWISTVAGTVHVTGDFECENPGGDGVGVEVLVDGQPAMPRVLIGGTNATIDQSFDFQSKVNVGSTIDFVVDPGPGLDINFDATAVEAKISLLK
jgi:Glycosyl hydrolase catalytic core